MHKADTRVTLDAKHSSKIKQFKQGMKSLKKLKLRKKTLVAKYNKLQNCKNSTLSDDELEKAAASRSTTRIGWQHPRAGVTKSDEYLLAGYELLTVQLLQWWCSQNCQKKEKKTLIKKNLSVIDFFTKSAPTTTVPEPKTNDAVTLESPKEHPGSGSLSDTECSDSSSADVPAATQDGQTAHSCSDSTAAAAATSSGLEFRKFSKNEIINNYMCLTDDRYINNIDYLNEDVDYCSDCNLEKIYYPSEGIIVCPSCAHREKILLDSDKPSYKEPPREISYFAYKRINHFNEWLAQFQAKESTDIPKSVYDKIKAEIKKESYLNKSNLKINKIREILNKINLSKYYEHVPHIINRLSGNPAPIISRETEDKLRMMFKEIQAPWIRYCPNNRSNFLSYSYVLYKFLQLLEFDEYLDYFNLLKSREKLAEADKIWKLICHELKWQFIKTIWCTKQYSYCVTLFCALIGWCLAHSGWYLRKFGHVGKASSRSNA